MCTPALPLFFPLWLFSRLPEGRYVAFWGKRSPEICLTGSAKAALTLHEEGRTLVPGKHRGTEASQHLISGPSSVCPCCCRCCCCASAPTPHECMSIFSKLPIKCLMSLIASRALEALTQTRCHTANLYKSIKLRYCETCTLTLLQA